MAKERKIPAKKAPSKKGDINLPEQDIKVEPGQPSFLPALKKIVKKKK